MDTTSVDIVIDEFEEKGKTIHAEVIRGLKQECIKLRQENEYLKEKIKLFPCT